MVTSISLNIIFPIFGLILLTEGLKFIKFRKLTCDPNPDVFENVSCTLKPLSWTKSVATVEADLKIDVYNYYVNAALYKQYGLNYQPHLINITQDVCKMLGGQRSSVIYANIIMHMAKKVNTNLLHRCPFKAGHIYGRNMEIYSSDMKLFDRFLPLGNFRVDGIGYSIGKNQNITVGSAALYVTVMEEFTRNGKKVYRTEDD